MIPYRPINEADNDARRTSNGKHCRLVVTGDPRGRNYTVREDIHQTLARASPEDIRKALVGWQRLHKRGVVLAQVATSEPICLGSGGHLSVFHEFEPRP